MGRSQARQGAKPPPPPPPPLPPPLPAQPSPSRPAGAGMLPRTASGASSAAVKARKASVLPLQTAQPPPPPKKKAMSVMLVPASLTKCIRAAQGLKPRYEEEPLPAETAVAQEAPGMVDSTGEEPGPVGPPPLPAKAFLTSGLYSSTARTPAGKRRPKTAAQAPTEALPMPINYGEKLLAMPHDYTLPYDIWYQAENNLLQLKSSVLTGTDKYARIIRNQYQNEADRVMSRDRDEINICNCAPEGKQGCSDNCLNRMMFIECSTAHCPCGEFCTNRRIQTRDWWKHTARIRLPNKGYGVKTKELIPKGTFIMEYLGEVMTIKQYQERVQTTYADRDHYHCLNLDSGLVVDGGSMGCEARFINHSCNPNCDIEKWNVLGEWRIGIFANRDIPAEEELSYDYNFQSFGLKHKRCFCGEANCRGFLTSKPKVDATVAGARKGGRRRPLVSRVQEETKRLMMELKRGLAPRTRAQVIKSRAFLARNFDRVRLAFLSQDERKYDFCDEAPNSNLMDEPGMLEAFKSKLAALLTGSTRSIRTRTVATVEADDQLDKMVQMAFIIKRQLHDLVVNYQYFFPLQGERRPRVLIVLPVHAVKEVQLATAFMRLPPRKRYPSYYKVIQNPLDLEMIEDRILKGAYTDIRDYEKDMLTLFANAISFNIPRSQIVIDARRLRTFFKRVFDKTLPTIAAIFASPTPTLPEADIMEARDMEEEAAAAAVAAKIEKEEVVRCICERVGDEGVMIQCERCLVWQHNDCWGLEVPPATFLCEQCEPRPVTLDIPLRHPSNVALSAEEIAQQSQDLHTCAKAMRQAQSCLIQEIVELETGKKSAEEEATALRQRIATLKSECKADKQKIEGFKRSLQKQNKPAPVQAESSDTQVVSVLAEDENNQDEMETDIRQQLLDSLAESTGHAAELEATGFSSAEEPRLCSPSLPSLVVNGGGSIMANGHDHFQPVCASDDRASEARHVEDSALGSVEEGVVAACSRGQAWAKRPALLGTSKACTTNDEALQSELQTAEATRQQHLQSIDECQAGLMASTKAVLALTAALRRKQAALDVLEGGLASNAVELGLVGRIFYTSLVVKSQRYGVGDCLYFSREEGPRENTIVVPPVQEGKAAAGDPQVSLEEVPLLRRTRIIVRVEEMWRDLQQRPWISGYAYLFPHQTHCKLRQKFFRDEVVLSDVVQVLDLTQCLGKCHVLRLKPYCLGYPKAADPEHVYICEQKYQAAHKNWKNKLGPDRWPENLAHFAFRYRDVHCNPVRDYCVFSMSPEAMAAEQAKKERVRKREQQQAEADAEDEESEAKRAKLVHAEDTTPAGIRHRRFTNVLSTLLEDSIERLVDNRSRKKRPLAELEMHDFSFLLSTSRKRRKF